MATATGVILGTAAYMAPEQAKGRTVDKRADVWAFGAVVYEMLAGKRAFGGGDVSDTLAMVLTKDVDWSALPAKTAASIQNVLKRCLEREPKKRVRDIGDVQLAMEGAFDSAAGDSATALPVSQPTGWRRVLPWVAGIVLAVVSSLTVWNLTSQRGLSTEPVRLTMAAPVMTSSQPDFAISADGRQIVYRGPQPGAAGTQLYLRSLDQLDAVPVRGSAGALNPFFAQRRVGGVCHRGARHPSAEGLDLRRSAGNTSAVAKRP